MSVRGQVLEPKIKSAGPISASSLDRKRPPPNVGRSKSGTYGREGDHSVENLCLMCYAHNVYLAELEYGKEVMDRYRRTVGSVRELAVSYGY